MRGLLLARSLPEAAWRSAGAPATPSFRVHCFVRNIEGLSRHPWTRRDGVAMPASASSADVSHAAPAPGEARGRSPLRAAVLRGLRVPPDWRTAGP